MIVKQKNQNINDTSEHLKKLTFSSILEYEVHSNWLAPMIGFSWGQELMGRYFAWKVTRKYKAYSKSLANKQWLKIKYDKSKI